MMSSQYYLITKKNLADSYKDITFTF